MKPLALFACAAVAVLAAVVAFKLATRPPKTTIPAVNGRVLEVTNAYASRAAWNLIPLPDAEVLVVWRAEVDVFADSQVMCVRAAHSRSGPDGTFLVPAAKMRSRVGSMRSASFAHKVGYVDVSVTSPPAEFGSTADHVRILRRVVDASNLPTREQQFFAIAGCPPTQ